MKRIALFALLPLAALALVAAMIATALVVREGGDDERPADAGASSAEEPEPSGAPRLAPESSVCQGILHVPEAGAP